MISVAMGLVACGTDYSEDAVVIYVEYNGLIGKGDEEVEVALEEKFLADTGESIDHLMRSLVGHEPASVEVATLLFKPESYQKKVPIKYGAITIPNDFIVGFGLDYDQLGRKQTLAEQLDRNKVVLLCFTAYQTEYSPAYNMKLAELYKRYKSRGLEIYQVSLDTEEQAWKVAADNLPWVCVRDPQTVYSSYAAMYNVKSLPVCFVVDKNDGIVKRIEKASEIESSIQSRL